MPKNDCQVHDPDDAVPGRICGRPLPCKDHGPSVAEILADPTHQAHPTRIHGPRPSLRLLLHDHLWEDRALTIRAVRRLADRLEDVANEAGSAGDADRDRLTNAWERMLASVQELVRGCT